MLDAVATINATFPVVSVHALKLFNQLTELQVSVFTSLVESWDVGTGEVVYSKVFDDDSANTCKAITAMVKQGIVKRVRETEGLCVLIINPVVLIPANLQEVQQRYESL